MEPARPDLAPVDGLTREEMRDLQVRVAESAVFRDDPPLDSDRLDEYLVAGVDQAFLDERAVSAVVVRHHGRTVERVRAVEPLSSPYIPGFLSFREGGPVLSALAALAAEPDLLLIDGSGRLHFREAGLATHLGVVLDVPAVGVAKGLLCGRPRGSLEDLAVGETVAIEADGEVDAPPGTVLGHAVQTRQFPEDTRHINPVFVSPGHRVGDDSAVAHVLAACSGYKIPEPIRRADAYADEVKASLEGSEP